MKIEHVWAALRISLGLIFLWAFLDKVFGLGFSTAADKSWLMGVSPTAGFLAGAKGFFAFFYNALSGSIFVDVLFMLGLLLIGIALVFGIAVTLASYSGALLMFLMWTALFPPAHHPFLDEHVIYLLVLLGIAHVRAGRWWGLGKEWEKVAPKWMR